MFYFLNKNQITMKKTMFLFLIPIMVSLLFVSCKGDDGKDGIDGTNGTNGTNGVNGTNGTDGANGAPGTANVIYSAWTTLNGSWRDSTIESSVISVNHLRVAGLTQEILDRGSIQVFTKWASSAVYSLPYVYYSVTAGDVCTLNYLLRLNKIVITKQANDNADPGVMGAANLYRYIIIPGGVLASKSTTDYSELSYEDLCYELGIPE